MNISIKNVDEEAFKKLKAAAVESGLTIGEAVSDAIAEWAERRRKITLGIEKIVEKARNDNDVAAVILFGSYARGERYYRDVDIALLLKDKNIDTIQKKVEYSVADIFDISVLNELPLFISSKVLEEGKVLYVSDRSFLEEFSVRTAIEWADFKPWFEESIGVK